MENYQLKLSAQRALLGEISNNVKAVAVNVKNNILEILVYFFKNPNSDDKDSYNFVTGEILADFPKEITDIKYNFIVWDGKSSFSTIKNLVFLRKD